MQYTLILVAAGSGSRFQSAVNKVWLPLNGQPLLYHSITRFLSDSDCQQVIVAVSKSDVAYVEELTKHFPQVQTVWGGLCREESVYNALIKVTTPYVLIHDAARPFVTTELIRSVKLQLCQHESVIPAIVVQDKAAPDRIVEMEGVLYRIQTPQGFHYDSLMKAFSLAQMQNKLADFRDDASVLEHYLGIKAVFVEGEDTNLKITYPGDLLVR